MASPPPGMSPQQTQQWANGFQSRLRSEGLDPSRFGFGQQSHQTGSAPQQDTRTSLAALPQKPAGDFSIYSPGQAQSQQSPWATATPYGQAPQWAQQLPFGGQNAGIPPFQFRATDFMGNQFDNPADFTAQQGAMAQALNQQRAQQVSQGNFGPLNPQLAYQQGQQMLQDGWQNPFAPPRDPAGNRVRGLLPGRDSQEYREWRSQQFTDMQAISPEERAAREQMMYERFQRERGEQATPPQGPPPGYGTPPSLRGLPRHKDWRDRDGDGVDDRDQDGPGMPHYYARPAGDTGALAPGRIDRFPGVDRGPWLGATAPNTRSPEWLRPLLDRQRPQVPRQPQPSSRPISPGHAAAWRDDTRFGSQAYADFARKQPIFVPNDPTRPHKGGRTVYPGQPGHAAALAQTTPRWHQQKLGWMG